MYKPGEEVAVRKFNMIGTVQSAIKDASGDQFYLVSFSAAFLLHETELEEQK